MINISRQTLILIAFISIIQPNWASSKISAQEGGERYISVMTEVGRIDIVNFSAQIAAIVTPTIKKIENGKTIASGVGGLIVQLTRARHEIGAWTMEPITIIPAADPLVCTVYFKWSSEAMPLHATMAILRFNPDMLIDEMYSAYVDEKKKDA